MLLCSGVRVRRWLEVVLDRIVTRAVRAAVEALYPPSRNGAPDGVDTDLANRTLSHINALPRTVRVQVKAMFLAVELLAPIAAPGGLFFSWRSPARRLADVQRWRHSWVDPLRLIATGLHAQLQMIYLSHPKVSAFMGEYKTVAYPDDPYVMPIGPLPPAPYAPETR
jgi:hypothetical protein